MHNVKMMNSALVMGTIAPMNELPNSQWRKTACSTKPPTQARHRSNRPVDKRCTNNPENNTKAENTQDHKPVGSLKRSGGTNPTHGNSNTVVAIPRLDGLKMRFVVPLSAGARNRNFDPIATATAK